VRSARQRRERKLARYLAELARQNPDQFKREWRTLLDAWSLEAYRRSSQLRQASGSAPLPVYGVLRKALRLLELCGRDARHLVGSATRHFLEHDCGRAFARAFGREFYALINTERNYELMKSGTHRPPR
jgi:hypothetical protein